MHKSETSSLNRLKARPQNDTDTWNSIACVALKNSSAIFIKTLTAIKVLVSIHGCHLSIGDVLERGKEQNHFSLFILNWDDVK